MHCAELLRERRLQYLYLTIYASLVCVCFVFYIWMLCRVDATDVKWHVLGPVSLCWLTKEKIFYGRYRYRHKLLIDSKSHIGQGSPAVGSVASEYLAVDVAAVNFADLKGGIRIRSLPTRLVQLPLEDKSHIAVLSWRSDFEHDIYQEPSRNVACPILNAKRKRIRYLFVDIISLNQNTATQDLIPQVARFATSYATKPVIAVYEDQCLTFPDVLASP
jgi:hypothetical protein